MTDTQRPNGDEDLSAAPEYEQLGEKGNPFSGDADLDSVPSEHGAASGESADDQNAPLPDAGPTDGDNGVDGDTSTS